MERERALSDFLMFPDGKKKAFTMSYDDGTIHDRKLVELMNRNGIRGTFNLNAGFLGLVRQVQMDDVKIDTSVIWGREVRNLYQNHEVAGHGLYHGNPACIGSSTMLYETVEDKRRLETLTGELVRGYAYPFGESSETTKEILKLAGYHYARSVETTGKFDLPKDFLEWRGTCHHDDFELMNLAKTFIEDSGFRAKVFLLWGHSYEFEQKNTWHKIEEFLSYMGQHGEEIWFATNIEICDYVSAYYSLEYSADGSMIYNPSATDVWIWRTGKAEHIGAGQVWRERK
ncbi:MAG: polysaccharide deacetylase family protein [Lachnospiraceae bacterium]|nr:polysaccharide deacetylase family protein [Lachnospiraceae bacterium]MDE6184815.1 polysaccharide deacetylase family protein [Lachnospiraceae bacterium]